MSRFVPALLLIPLLLCPAARAGDAGNDARADAAAKAALEAFRNAWKSDDEAVRMEALLELARTRHRTAIEEIGKTVLTDPSPEVRQAGALALAKVDAPAEVAGPLLARRLPLEEDHPEVQVEIIRAIADVGWLGAHDALVDAAMRFLEEDYRFVTSEVMRAFGRLGDRRSLPFLLALLEYQGEILRGRRGPTVRASSDAEAKKIYDAKYKKFAYPKGTPECIVKWWLEDLVDALGKLTGEELESAEDLRAWMKEHAKELGFKAADLNPKKLTPKEPKNPPPDAKK